MLTGDDSIAQGGRSDASTNRRAVGSDYDRLGAVQELIKHCLVAVGPWSVQRFRKVSFTDLVKIILCSFFGCMGCMVAERFTPAQ